MAKKACIAMLLAGGEGKRLAPLTSKIAKPAVHFGGNYRIIDFPLSNCVNSGIDTVGVLTQYEAESLHGHIGKGEPWKLNTTKDKGVTLLPSWNTGSDEYCGTADAIYKNIEYIDAQDPENVLILSGDHIYQMDYRKVLKYHEEKQALATIAVMEVPWNEAHRFGVLNTNEDMRVTEFVEKPAQPESNLASMGIYVFNWKHLKKHLIEDAASTESSHDFGKDIIPSMLKGEDPLYVYNFEGYWKDVGTVQSLWDAHMDVLNGVNLTKEELEAWPMYSRQGRTKLTGYRQKATISKNSIVHDQCYMEGNSDRSVIFYGAEIGRNSTIKESVIMPNARIGRNVTIDRAIIGEGAIIRDGAVIKGSLDEIVVIGPGETVAGKPSVRTNRLLKDVYEKAGQLRATSS
ncbi:glucose-1-phosphate adenylyltransferase [Paenibacillus polygoni]|uniref:Glucose-1-phosphate adenylyltransferase n=1 Tax=Paenibacillus polygoni TaxID=3050112 RepID=A0ABY8WZH2_9BACL|nr:glucose-1-phosphate adenylyltransferase [Paenibacillus polygoni]WIV17789.1 glucose-1-phosphate adenylyltransferase [Paenibacillus polygoni]